MGENRYRRQILSLYFLTKSHHSIYYRYQGRKISKKISPANLELINSFYKKFSNDNEIIENNLLSKNNKKISFDKTFEKINIEIGFGDGEYLLKQAIANPSELFIGSEFYVNGIVKVLKKIIKLNINNIILSNINCLYLLKALHSKSVDNLYIINPDPWVKKKHNKRRLIVGKNIELFKKIIKKENSIFITTDSPNYLKAMQHTFIENKKNLGDIKIKILTKKDKLYGISKYQRKAIEKGGKIYQVTI